MAVDRMKAISLLQPWASLVMMGLKHWETRSWPTKHKGDIAIHASKGMCEAGCDLMVRDETLRMFAAKGMFPSFNELPRGVVLGVCSLHQCVRSDSLTAAEVGSDAAYGDFSSGRWCWFLMVKEKFKEPVPARGMQGLWNWERPGV